VDMAEVINEEGWGCLCSFCVCRRAELDMGDVGEELCCVLWV
jgi:hypothetical protein